ncbi:endothelial lipase-like [Diorhabda carinulata]|uniref:endothelial lipase-like n=1 Tax=Diorhabda carinulata TaxID=1163345 RepID=UPI0025A265A2|nr:endothelial lipase-like [Diorhabda carinulata]
MKMMKFFVLFFILFNVINISFTEDDNKSVLYNFYTANKKNEPVAITVDTVENLEEAGFDVAQKTVFLVYSFEEPSVMDSKCHLKDEILSQNSVNLFMVDWSTVTTQNYLVAQGDVVAIGQYLADFINILETKFTLKTNDVTIIGWDLGAHVAGIAGKQLTNKLSTIIGLDPSGPLFTENNKLNRLDVDDATFVQVIHTNTIINGIEIACGTADYYPNGGTIQNSCGNDVTGVCSHERALTFFVESITSDRFVSCANYDSYKNGECDDSDKSVMGRLNVDTSAKGKYYLDTNDVAPYAKG